MENTLSNNNEVIIKRIESILDKVMDPEVPVLSVRDLGIIREIHYNTNNGENHLTVTITPTYSGCPALNRIKSDIYQSLAANGFNNVEVKEVLSPAWTTDWMSSEGKDKLKAYGIAPPTPVPIVCDLNLFMHQEAIQCPRCNSYNTKLISMFGSTPCKALYACSDCKEPFDHFKCH